MSDKYTLVQDGLDQRINCPNNGGECCQTLEDTVDELNHLLDRIKRLNEFVDQLTNPKFTRDDLPKEALLQRIKRLEEACDEALMFCEFHGPVGATPDTAYLVAKNLRKAKEAKL